MEKVNLEYSTKNIPIHNKNEYRLSLIQKTRKFLQNLRWKAHFYLKPSSKSINQNNFGFKSEKNAPPVLAMKAFEEDMIKLVENVEFKNPSQCSSEFQKKISKDIKNIRETPKSVSKGR